MGEQPEQGGPRYSRAQFVKGAGVLAALGAAGAGAGVGIWRAVSDGEGEVAGTRAVRKPGAAPTLDEFAANVVAGGPGRGGIPAIGRPEFLFAERASFLRDDDLVFGLVRGSEARAYPQIVLVWHEIVNDVFGNQPLTVTYCPLTGSVVSFRATSPDGQPLTFNTTGRLVNSNLLMFDRETDSEWPQLLAQAISGPQKGERLAEIPLVWTTWKQWRAVHPNTRVLSPNTGFARPYGNDPYGSYTPVGGYYEPDTPPIFPVMGEPDRRFASKEVLIGVKAGEARVAVKKLTVERQRVLPFEAGRTPLVAIWDEQLATARVFESRVGRRRLRFRGGSLRDATSGSTWSPSGEAVRGPLSGQRLRSAVFLDVMWFSWFAFFPQTKVVS